jgi:hypothetical protein
MKVSPSLSKDLNNAGSLPYNPSIPTQLKRTPNQRGINPHLTVVNLAKTPIPLPPHANGFIALLGDPALIKQQRTLKRATQQSIRFQGDLIQDASLVPASVSKAT